MFLLISIPFNKIHSKFMIDTVFLKMKQHFNSLNCLCDTEIEAREIGDLFGKYNQTNKSYSPE